MTAEGTDSQDIYKKLDQYITANLRRFISELGTLCARPGGLIPSKRDKTGLVEPTRLITEMFKERGLRVENWTSGNRLTLFARTDQRPSSPTVLSYNSMILQSAAQADEWSSAMFGLNEREGYLYAQGIADNRANLVARLAALEAWREVYGSVPVNVKFLVEGLSEPGGSHLAKVLENKATNLTADVCLWDSGENTPDSVPVLSLGQKGLLTVELVSKTLASDGDSSLAGIFPSGGWRLVWALSAIKNDNEDIQIEGFDTDIHVPTHEDSGFLVETLAQYRARLDERLKHFGQTEYLMGLRGLPLLITEFFTPTANIVGINGGYTGDKFRPLLMSGGRARVDFRLVPDQDPDTIFNLLNKHFKNRGLTDVTVTKVGMAEKPARTSPGHPFVRLAVHSVEQATEHLPLVIPLAPTIGPMYEVKQALQDLPIVCAGSAHGGSKNDTPDENIREIDFLNHIKFMVRLLGNMEKYEGPLPPPPVVVATPDILPAEIFNLEGLP